MQGGPEQSETANKLLCMLLWVGRCTAPALVGGPVGTRAPQHVWRP